MRVFRGDTFGNRQHIIGFGDELQGGDEVGDGSGDCPGKTVFTQHIIDIAARFSARGDLNMRQRDEFFERQWFTRGGMTFAQGANEAIREQLPNPHFLGQFAVNADSEIGAAVAQGNRIIGGIGDKPNAGVGSLFAKDSIEGRAEDREDIIGGMHDERAGNFGGEERALGFEGLSGFADDGVDAIFQGFGAWREQHAASRADEDRVIEAVANSGERVAGGRGGQPEPARCQGDASFLQQGIEGDEEAEIGRVHGLAMMRDERWSGQAVGG